MLLNLSRWLLLAPALTFWLGAAFVLSAYRLGAAPADPGAWQAYLTLTPIIREPVSLVAGLPGLGYASALLVFAFAGVLGFALALSPLKMVRPAFIYAHLAFLTLFHAMTGAGVFTASAAFGSDPRLDWFIDFSGFPVWGTALFLLVLASCATFHFRILRYFWSRVAVGRGGQLS